MPKDVNLRKRREARDKILSEGRATRRNNGARRKRTSEAYMLAVIEEIGSDSIRDVVRCILEQAVDGDKAAWEWIGKYVLGNGKINLADLSNPGMLKRQ